MTYVNTPELGLTIERCEAELRANKWLNDWRGTIIARRILCKWSFHGLLTHGGIWPAGCLCYFTRRANFMHLVRPGSWVPSAGGLGDVQNRNFATLTNNRNRFYENVDFGVSKLTQISHLTSSSNDSHYSVIPLSVDRHISVWFYKRMLVVLTEVFAIFVLVLRQGKDAASFWRRLLLPDSVQFIMRQQRYRSSLCNRSLGGRRKTRMTQSLLSGQWSQMARDVQLLFLDYVCVVVSYGKANENALVIRALQLSFES